MLKYLSRSSIWWAHRNDGRPCPLCSRSGTLSAFPPLHSILFLHLLAHCTPRLALAFAGWRIPRRWWPHLPPVTHLHRLKQLFGGRFRSSQELPRFHSFLLARLPITHPNTSTTTGSQLHSAGAQKQSQFQWIKFIFVVYTKFGLHCKLMIVKIKFDFSEKSNLLQFYILNHIIRAFSTNHTLQWLFISVPKSQKT